MVSVAQRVKPLGAWNLFFADLLLSGGFDSQ